MRPLVLLLLALPALAGCLAGDDEPGRRLAQPTDAPPVVPRRASVVADPARPDLTDPGFPLTEPWRPGDAWDWESGARWRSLRVVESQVLQGRPHLRVVQANGTLGPGPAAKVEWWVDARDYAKVNQTGLAHARDAAFSPPAQGPRPPRLPRVGQRRGVRGERRAVPPRGVPLRERRAGRPPRNMIS